MAEAHISHFVERTTLEKRAWKAATERAVAKVIYGLDEPIGGYVTVKTPPLDLEGSSSDKDTEVNVFVSGNDWPSLAPGTRLDWPEAMEESLRRAAAIGELLVADLQLVEAPNVWVPHFSISGWWTGGET